MLPQIAGGGKLLDLGCGLGQLSRHFSGLGFDVTAVDFSENALDFLKIHSPNIKTLVHDITQPLPFDNAEFDIVIANLSFHYFNKKNTRNAISEIKRVLKNDGVLIGSVVSIEEFAVAKNEVKLVEIEPNYYYEDYGNDKIKHIRFFSRQCIDEFFAGFDFLYLENEFKQRMGKSKGAWEFILKKPM